MNSSHRRRIQKCPVPGYRCKRRTRCNKTERRCSIASLPTRQFSRRCVNGSRRQEEGDGCVETNSTKYERCKNGTRRDKRTHECDAGVVYMFKNRKRILAKGQRIQRMDKSANARVKKHNRFALIPDAPGAAEYREQRLKDYVPEELPMAPVGALSPKPKSPRKPNENLANPFKVRSRKSSPGSKLDEMKEDEAITNDFEMNDFDQGDKGDYHDNDGNGIQVVEENPRKLSPIQEVENEDNEESPRQMAPRKTPKNENKVFHNTRSSSQRTRSEKAKYKVDYGSRKSRKSMR